MPEPRQSSFSDFVNQCDLLSQPLSGNLVSYPVSSGPSQHSSQPAHLRYQYPHNPLSSSFLRHQHSDPYIITEMTNVPYSFTLLYCLISIFCTLCQKLPRPVRFFALCPSCTCPSVSPSIFISTVICCFPFVIVFVFSTLILSQTSGYCCALCLSAPAAVSRLSQPDQCHPR